MIIRTLFLLISVALVSPAVHASEGPVSFHDIVSLGDMRQLVSERFQPGTPRQALQDAFVTQGGATLIQHPSFPHIEKYLYDINLCHYYVWRWNISADFDEQDRAAQVYVNGEPVFETGQADRLIPKVEGDEESEERVKIFTGQRPRPEAHKGESSLGYVLMDKDGDLSTEDDQQLIGAGPSRADPLNLGSMRAYTAAPWRSIFDHDAADRISDYEGDCAAADAAYQR